MLVELEGVLSPEEAAQFESRLRQATFVDGKVTARGRAKDLKHNLQLPPSDPLAKELAQSLQDRFGRMSQFSRVAHPRRMIPVRFCRYELNMSYGDHLDVPLMSSGDGKPFRTDLSMTVFLSDPGTYEGGALVFHSEYGQRAIRGKAGSAVVYPSSMLHRVEPVTKGSRVVGITWIESLIRDAAQRKIVYDLANAIEGLEKRLGASSEIATLRQTHYNLIRTWAET